jgi:hypothetical protein
MMDYPQNEINFRYWLAAAVETASASQGIYHFMFLGIYSDNFNFYFFENL